MTDPRPIWDAQDFADFQTRQSPDQAARAVRTCAKCGEASMVRGTCARCGAGAAPPLYTQGSNRGGGDLEIVDEIVIAAIPRGDEELRVTFTRGRTSAGKDVAWHSIRVFYRDGSGAWKPGKQGVTIRGRELAAVAAAFAKATSGGVVK